MNFAAYWKEKILQNLDKICLDPMGDFCSAESLKNSIFRNATDYYYSGKQGESIIEIVGEEINLDQFKGDDFQEIRSAIISDIKKNHKDYWIENENGAIVIKHKSGRKHWKEGLNWGRQHTQEWAEIEEVLKNSQPQNPNSKEENGTTSPKKWYKPSDYPLLWIIVIFLTLFLLIVATIFIRKSPKRKDF